ncbi:hypothetical protein [Nocardia veterana]|uniref:Uncharacterized protein n=1 Tax=Nocardia veterana TaxID=132249 RepID=A0A7X6LY70_9NOCA|nr:hypothetical protein [Nocardia veterana]NKY86717.1 hypothetical protein [Nocardia veterana]
MWRKAASAEHQFLITARTAEIPPLNARRHALDMADDRATWGRISFSEATFHTFRPAAQGLA